MRREAEPFVAAGVAAFCWTASFPPMSLSPLAWGVPMGCFWLARKAPGRRGFCIALAAFWLADLSALWWVRRVTWLGLFPLSLYVALYQALFVFLASRIDMSRPLSCLFLPSLWVSLEFARSRLFTGFPWLLLGYTQYQHRSIVGLSRWGGVYAVSFFVVLCSACAWIGWSSRSRTRRLGLLAIGPLVFLAMTLVPFPEPRQGLFTVGLVQGNIGYDEKWEPALMEDLLLRQRDLTFSMEDPIDLIAWPETAIPAVLLEDQRLVAFVSDIAKKAQSFFLVGGLRFEAGKSFNSAFLFDSQGQHVGSYDKIHLVPFGEYVPGANRWPFLQRWIPEAGSESPGTEVRVFEIETRLGASKVHIAPVICYEGIFPELCRRFTMKGAQCLINTTNEAWYGPGGMQRQHLAMYIFRAVELGVPVLRAANTGISCAIDPTGRILARVAVGRRETFVAGTLRCEVPFPVAPPFYARHGDIFAGSACCLALVLFAFQRKAIRRPRRAGRRLGRPT